MLLTRRSQIIEDVQECLAATTHPGLAVAVDAVEEAVAALEAGVPRAAQALAGVTLSSVIHDVLKRAEVWAVSR